MSIIKTGISEKKHKIPHKPSEIFMREPLKQNLKLEMDIYQGKRYLFNILTKTFHPQKMWIYLRWSTTFIRQLKSSLKVKKK